MPNSLVQAVSRTCVFAQILTRICSTHHGDAIVVPLRGTQTWRPEINENNQFCCKDDYFSLVNYCISESIFIQMLELFTLLQIAGEVAFLYMRQLCHGSHLNVTVLYSKKFKVLYFQNEGSYQA